MSPLMALLDCNGRVCLSWDKWGSRAGRRQTGSAASRLASVTTDSSSVLETKGTSSKTESTKLSPPAPHHPQRLDPPVAKASKQWLSIILTSPKLQLIWKENTATRHTLCLDRAMICPDDLLWGQALFILGLPMQLRQHIYMGTKVKHTLEVLQSFIFVCA